VQKGSGMNKLYDRRQSDVMVFIEGFFMANALALSKTRIGRKRLPPLLMMYWLIWLINTTSEYRLVWIRLFTWSMSLLMSVKTSSMVIGF